MRELLIYMALYLLPAAMMFYMAADVLMRNHRRTEHLLLSAYIACYGVLFTTEFIRQQVDLSYSPFLITYVFGNAGLLILCLSIHFIIKITGVYEKFPSFLYPWVLYIPALPIPLTLIFQSNFTNSTSFEREGLFIYPDFNAAYLATMGAGLTLSFFIIWMLHQLGKKAVAPQQKRIISLLIVVAILVQVWNFIFGIFEFRGTMPPYPYIYGGIIWIGALAYGMKKFDFLASYHKRFSTLHEINPSPILLIDREGMIESANPAALALLGEQSIKGKQFTDYLSDDRKEGALTRFQYMFDRGERISQYESRIQTEQGEKKYILIDGDFVFVEHNLYILCILRDVQMYKEAEETIRFLAYHDPLTRLPNRRAFYEEAAKALRGQQTTAMLILDLDDFKSVNDTFGHQTGDEYLKHVGEVLKETVGDQGLAARVGGDEFFAYLQCENEAAFKQLIFRLMKQFENRPYWAENTPLEIRFSLGISCYPHHGTKLETLIYKADQAMYKIKRNGKNDFYVWNEELETSNSSR
ncbi:sensor domain-containing diguanylate cyclase [Jeotgalibacillus haloalkalitolerans]|uniref:Sensor domain-containing diguanylate cyclase n=1 Tax=Jeotgalibacillus haloalkalitolerans TaxID=3104292 RepID=A0ABU5KHB1_9BACL|nr:sensor domain-containing diguanylate cyclase [Jeotgalibacillus sp. HH7-29]MDZ5710630.1 sensor domain-containing diguanylate cyclase [Jeotgalibacillus sp. HH7-29]